MDWWRINIVNDDSLLNLLHEADRAIERPSLQPDLQGRVIRRARQQRLARRSATLLVVLVAIIPLIFLRHAAMRSKPLTVATITTPQIAKSPDTDELDAMVAQKTADAILRLRRQQIAISLSSLDRAQQLRLDQDATAAMLLAAGDHFARDPAHVQQGADDYHRVQTFYPGTTWAAAAGERLKQLHS
jgi:hypothetical protein